MFYFNSAGLLGLTRIHWRSDIVRTGYYLSVVVLMGDRVRLGLVGGKTVPPPPHVGFLLAEASSPRPPNTRVHWRSLIHWRSDIVRTGYYLSVSNQANQTNLGGQVKTLWFLDVSAYVN